LTRRLLILALALTAVASAAPAAHASSPGALVQLPGLDACISDAGADNARGIANECRDGQAMNEVTSLALSPDGRSAYAVGFFGGLSIMARDPASGALTPLGCVRGTGGIDGGAACSVRATLGDLTDVLVSPDGKNVYVASENGIDVFSRDPATGLLSNPPGKAACISEDGSKGACVDGKVLDEPNSLAISPDGKFLYSADGRGGVAVLRRAADGSLSQSTDPQAGCITQDGFDPGDGSSTVTSCVDGKALGNPDGIAISPDGKNVYVSDEDSQSAIAVLRRDGQTGELSQDAGKAGCLSEKGEDRDVMDVCNVAKAIEGIGPASLSPDGRFVYTTSFNSSAISIFKRDGSTGELTQDPGPAACVSEDGSASIGGPVGECAVGRGLEALFGITVSPDGKNLYGTSSVFGLEALASTRARGLVIEPGPAASSGGVAAFDRDPATGALQQLPGGEGCLNEVGGPVPPQIADGCSPAIALQSANDPTASPDGKNLYVPAEESDAIAEFAHPGPPPAGPAGNPRDVTAPKISRFSISSHVFAVAAAATPVSALARGTTFHFALSETSRVRISIQRVLPGRRAGKNCRKPTSRLVHKRACKRFVAAGALSRSENAGASSVKFSGRIGRRALRAGRYRATIRATDAAGNTSTASSVSFRIVKLKASGRAK
jgi:DNA-binding beta-propeller fold protein YncE